jgi:hypothetical protein
MTTRSSEITVNEKAAALEAVLASQSFARSDQLKCFLRYICEQEIAGHGSELTEYRIGVQALGRPEAFSPVEDSIVRNRAHALRKRLEEFYAQEAPSHLLRIELPKGYYVPRFVAPLGWEETPALEIPERLPAEPSPAISKVNSNSRRFGVGALVAAFLVGSVISVLCVLTINTPWKKPGPAPVLQSVWGSMLRPGGTVLLSVATPPQSYIRPFPVSQPPIPGIHPLQGSIAEWYRKQRPDGKDLFLFQTPTFNSPLWGDTAGAVRIASMLNGFGASTDLIPERLVTSPIFRNRNVVFFGREEYSPTVQRLLKGMPLHIGYDVTAGDYIAYEIDKSGKVIGRFIPARESPHSGLSAVFGLISILPAEGDGEQQLRYVIISGISSAGIQAAAEYIASPFHLEALSRRLDRPATWPGKLQILIHASTTSTVALSFGYETHRIAP